MTDTTPTRRRFLTRTAGIATAGAIYRFWPAEGATPRDPLLEVLQAYNEGMAEYERQSDGGLIPDDNDAHEALAQATYDPPLLRLLGEDLKTTTPEGASEALKFAMDWGGLTDPLACKMIRAAIGYLEAGRA
jgi:hypothetical protein